MLKLKADMAPHLPGSEPASGPATKTAHPEPEPRGPPGEQSPEPAHNALGEAIADLEAQIASKDGAAVRRAAHRLRTTFSDVPDALVESGRALYNIDDFAEAAADLSQAVRLAPDHARGWFFLGLVQNERGNAEAAIEALSRAQSLDPDSVWPAAALAGVKARAERGWETALATLAQLQQNHSGETALVTLLAEIYLYRALQGWTVVSSNSDGNALAETAKGLIRVAAGTDVEPGLYATEPLHVKNARAALARLKALPIEDDELRERVADLEKAVAGAAARRLHGTWAEIGVGVITLLSVFMYTPQSPPIGLFMLISGVALLVGSLEPQYRMNRILLSRRGQTVGDAVIGLARHHRYGGIAYSLFVLACFPFIGAYKVYMNWGREWLTRSPLDDLPTGAMTALADDTESLPDNAPSEQRDPALDEPAFTQASPPSTPPTAKSGLQLPAFPPIAWMGIGGGALCLVGVIIWLSWGGKTAAPEAMAAPAVPAAATSTNAATLQPPLTLPRGPISGSPQVIDTATLRIGDDTARLDGVIGLEGEFAVKMDSFIIEQGGSVNCRPARGETYRCLTASGYDVAAAALMNGAAKAADDAPPEYVRIEADAHTSGRGVWR